SRREPSGARQGHGPGADHQPESRLCGGPRDAARQRADHACIAVRRNAPGLCAHRQAGVLLPGTSRGEPGSARPRLSVRPLREDDGKAGELTVPKRTDIESVLIIGAGPIIIGQACEFDYSGAQACKALKAEGYKVILVNSNPATIMTDPEM